MEGRKEKVRIVANTRAVHDTSRCIMAVAVLVIVVGVVIEFDGRIG